MTRLETIAALAEEAATLDIITKEHGLDLAVTAIHARDPAVRFEALKVLQKIFSYKMINFIAGYVRVC